MLGHIIYCLSFQMTYILYQCLKREGSPPCSSPKSATFTLSLLEGGGEGACPNLGYVHVYHFKDTISRTIARTCFPEDLP